MVIRRYTASELEALPTILLGHFESMKAEGDDDIGPWRVWLSRCTVADGEPYENRVTLERFDAVSHKWEAAETYPG